jgi:hypothetical protein
VFQPHLQRSYPEKTLASNILGLSAGKGKVIMGSRRSTMTLAGLPITVWMPNDPNRAMEAAEGPGWGEPHPYHRPEIQSAMEARVDAAIEENGAESGTIVVMDPETGEVLAMATTPAGSEPVLELFGGLYRQHAFQPGNQPGL